MRLYFRSLRYLKKMKKLPDKSGIEVSVFQPRSHVRLRKVRISHQNITFLSFFLFPLFLLYSWIFFFLPFFFLRVFSSCCRTRKFLLFFISVHVYLSTSVCVNLCYLFLSVYPLEVFCVFYPCLFVHLCSVLSIYAYLSTCVILCYPSLYIYPLPLFCGIYPCLFIHPPGGRG